MNVLDPEFKIAMTMTAGTFDALPIITAKDLLEEWEWYRILLGSWKLVKPKKLLVTIENILEIPNSPDCYVEGKEIDNINILKIKEFISVLKKKNPEYRRLNLVGDIHCHSVPTTESDGKWRTWHPSAQDMVASVDLYQKKFIDKSEPFLTGVAGIMEDLRTGYSFYYLVKEVETYFIRGAEWE